MAKFRVIMEMEVDNKPTVEIVSFTAEPIPEEEPVVPKTEEEKPPEPPPAPETEPIEPEAPKESPEGTAPTEVGGGEE